MSAVEKPNQESHSVPFFAHYLEGQIEDLSEQEMSATVGGGCIDINKIISPPQTLKYPSDREDNTGDIEFINTFLPTISSIVDDFSGFLCTLEAISDPPTTNEQIFD